MNNFGGKFTSLGTTTPITGFGKKRYAQDVSKPRIEQGTSGLWAQHANHCATSISSFLSFRRYQKWYCTFIYTFFKRFHADFLDSSINGHSALLSFHCATKMQYQLCSWLRCELAHSVSSSLRTRPLGENNNNTAFKWLPTHREGVKKSSRSAVI